ncbi:OLC1v1014152C1 [Oldenlandia corymbosa var. corymbosa]|uniref:OLC1v1014152C1 n=1 Tax=Oldenlandia corymbosa var. corymbosa TaxID=529605 RepID=A0AAV1E3N7_OLDCO|nr:OLC1v1014152C1 [Oldenlandia corymbosa var. corymbosa]
MKEDVRDHQLQLAKIFSFQRYFQSLVLYFLVFGSGLVIGITLSFYLTDTPLTFQSTIFPLFNNPPPQQPPPPPPSPPPPEPVVCPPETKCPESNPNPITADNPTAPAGMVSLKEYITPPETMHQMTDEELLWRASMVPRIGEYPFRRTPKVAFMFLVRGELPLAPLWELFFKGHEGLYSIYVHALPSFHGTLPDVSVFHGRRIPSKEVEWGKSNMIEAERRLLANALLDYSNERFVLLSESCIPLFNFQTIYDYLIYSTETFVESYDLPGPVGQGRYSTKMKPQIRLEQWRKGAQWFEMNRELAIRVVSDRVYFPVFRKHCQPPCYSDEHYIPTLVYMKFEQKNSNRTLHWVDWSKGGPHPSRFGRYEISAEFLEQMRNNQTCTYNGKTTKICHLFARKFMPVALDRLLSFNIKILFAR